MTLVLAPLAMSSLGDAHVALGRIGKILLADEIGDDYPLNDDMGVRIHGDFTWESVGPPSSENKSKQFGKSKAEVAKEKAEAKLSKEELAKKKAEEKAKKEAEKERKAKIAARRKARRQREEAGEDVFTDDEADDADELGHHLGVNEMTPFMLKDLDLEISKGRLVVVCGPVGSGKSALLQAMAGEMRKVKGTVAFGGRVAYHPQHPWIQNMTLRDNVLFGAPDDPERFDDVVEACALRQDIQMLPNGEKTELGERGVTISGGQKARVSLARVAYNDADVILLDDPIAAVDAHVGRHILHRCILTGPMANKTRVLVTHALHVFPFADEIIYMEDGRIVEQGAYTDLVQAKGHFAKLIEEHGGEKEKADDEGDTAGKGAGAPGADAEKHDGPQQHLMVDEERETGAVKGEVYAKYLKAAGSPLWFPFLILLLTLTQVSQVGNNLLLGFWSRESIPGWTEGQYLGLYAGFGISQALFTFVTSFAFSYAGFHASLYLFMRALGGVVSSPLSFHDTTPVGRIISRLSKDVDTLDFQLPSNGFSFSLQASSVLGTIGLTIYAYNWLGLMFPPLFIFYYIVQTFYRRTSREAKRLDSLLRSFLYASYMEALNGISTVRAFRMQDRFVTTTENLVDSNNTAYLLTIAAQRWLSVRMDVLGNTVILGIGLAAVGFRTTQSPATLGVVLTYALSITQSLSMIVQQLAQLEQDMNVVERVLFYSELPREGEAIRDDDPPESWPSAGAIEFEHVELRYRPELPLVLKGVNISIKPGERVGIIGRTGSGKSSLLAALWHTVSLAGGRILIDGVDIDKVGLATLRQRMSIVPQDTTIFDTTLRDNIDPTGKSSDAEMYAALRAVGLLDANSSQAPSGTATPAMATTDGTPVEGAGKNRFHLDTECREDSYSSGQKQLIGLARALVKDSRIVVLDEATASVDVEADARVQHMIQTLRGRTLLCIAHRLNTVVYSDRVLVMGDGKALEFDEPLTLFDRPGSAFRAMCDQASLTRENIEKIRENAAQAQRLAAEGGMVE